MQEDIKEIKADVKEISKDITLIKTVLATNTSSLDLHIKRTDLAEQRISKIEYWLLGMLASIIIALLSSLLK